MVKSPLVSPLVILSKISSIEVQNFIYPWMRFWARPTRFFWPKGSRSLLEVNFKGVMKTSSRREFRIFRLSKGLIEMLTGKTCLYCLINRCTDNHGLENQSGDWSGPTQTFQVPVRVTGISPELGFLVHLLRTTNFVDTWSTVLIMAGNTLGIPPMHCV